MDKVKQTLTKIWVPLKAKLDAIDKKVKVGILAGVAVLVVAIIIFAIIMGQTGYSVLYSGTSTSESAEIVQYCRDTAGVTDVRLNSNGDILVPSDQLEKLRVELSIAGYPKSAFNYDIWNNGVTMFSTQAEILETQKQQLQNHLMTTLRSIDGVDSAIVLLNIPKSENYVISDSKEKASASAVLQLRSELDSAEIQGIYNLIKNSVPGLEEGSITVTDGTGKTLIGSASGDVSESEQARLKLYYQRLDYQEKLRQILEDGLDTVMKDLYSDYRITVALTLNYDNQVTENTTYTPSVDSEGTHGGMVSNQTDQLEAGGQATDGGLVGTSIDADISEDYPNLVADENGDLYIARTREVNYLVNTEKTQIEKDGYSIENLTAGVSVDTSSMTNDEEQKLKELVAASIGTSADKISVFAKPFNVTSGSPGISDGNLSVTSISSSNAILLAVIIVLGVVLIVLLVLALTASGSKKKRRVTGKRAAEAAGAAPVGRSAAAAMDEFVPNPAKSSPASARNAIEAAEDAFELHSLNDDVPETRDEALKREIRDFSKTNPEIVAQLIRTWMRDE